MSTAPLPYERVTSFFSYEATYPAKPKPGAQLDAEFNAIRTTLNGVLSRLGEIQRDDGKLANASVHLDALTPDVLALLGADLTPALTKSYASTGQTITQAGLLTLAHGFGVRPRVIRAYLQCTTDNAGYVVGDRVEVPIGFDHNAAVVRGITVYFDTTNINVRFANAANTFILLNKSTGDVATITNSSWQLYIEAFA